MSTQTASSTTPEPPPPGLLATNNYGAQVAYNYGSVSNYFCNNLDGAHQCHFPENSLTEETLGDQLYKTIEQARGYYSQKRWEAAKILFQDVLHSPYAALVATERILLQYNLAHTHFLLFEFSEAASQFQDILDIYQERNEPAQKSVSDSRYWLGRSFFHLKRHEDASEELQYFILTHDQGNADEAEKVTAARLWLGLSFDQMGRHSLAKGQLECALEDRVRILGSEHLDTMASRHHLANFLYKQKDYLQAQEHFSALLLVESNFSGPEKAQATRTRCMLAFCLAKADKFNKAKPHLELVLSHMESFSCLRSEEIRDTGLPMISHFLDLNDEDMKRHMARTYGHGDSMHTQNGNRDDLRDELAGCRCYQAHVMVLLGQEVAAEHAFRQILDNTNDLPPELRILVHNGLARSLISQKKYAEAKIVLKEVIDTTSSLNGCCHTGEDLVACLHTLGDAHLRMEETAEARGCFQRVVDVVPETPNERYCHSQLSLGMAQFRLRQFESAHSHFNDTFQTLSKKFRKSDLLLFAECNLSMSLCEIGRYDDAEVHLRPLFTILSGIKDRRLMSDEVFMLGYSHLYQGRAALHRQSIPEATKHLRQGLGMIGQLQGLESSSYLECRYYLAYSLYMQRSYDEARPMFQELSTSEVLVGPLHDIRLVLAPYWLGHIAQAQRQNTAAEDHFAKCLASLSGDKLPLYPYTSSLYVRYWHANSLYQLHRMAECSKNTRELLSILDQTDNDNNYPELPNRLNLLLGHSLHDDQRFEESCEDLKSTVKHLEGGHGFDGSKWSLSRAYFVDSLSELGRFEEAAPHLLQLRTSPEGGSTIPKAITSYWLGRRCFRDARFNQRKAEEHFLNAQKFLGGSLLGTKGTEYKRMRLDCQHFLARCRLQDKNYDDADEVFRAMAQQQYESGDLAHAVDNQYWLAQSLFLRRMYSSVIPLLEKIVADNMPGRLTIHAVSASLIKIGESLYHQQKHAEAKKRFELALEFPNVESQHFLSPYNMAHCSFQMGLYDDARALFQRCLDHGDKDPRQTLSQYWLGRSYFELRDWKQAAFYLEKAALHGRDKLSDEIALESQFFYGRSQLEAGRYEKALAPFLGMRTRAAKSQSGSILLLRADYYAASAWYERGQFQASRRTLLEVHPKFQKLQCGARQESLNTDFLLARGQVGLGLYFQARTKLEAIVKIPWHQNSQLTRSDQTVMLGNYDLGRIAFRNKQWSRAQGHFQSALLTHETHGARSTLDPVQCQTYLGITLQALQQAEEAKQLYQRVLEARSDETTQAPRQTLLDVKLCLGHTSYRLEKRGGLDECQDGWGEPKTLTGPCHPYNLRRDLMLAYLTLRVSEFQKAEELYVKVLALIGTSQEARDWTPVPVAYLHPALAVTFSKAEKVNEAQDHALKALEADCSHAHGCKSFDGFAEAFPELLTAKIGPAGEHDSAAKCSEPAHHPKETTTPVKGHVRTASSIQKQGQAAAGTTPPATMRILRARPASTSTVPMRTSGNQSLPTSSTRMGFVLGA
ncbi:hypothetical protein BDV96DRAFT_643218 [Lophiotrema nucula]|uniref:TPR-like protein n=1 Tax=Lophiotrema nucula TaxID=690887 RepID=A0A6A5ZLF0_9PLEO|nr:hypothetical protein BDV96DRAFT_643218 [Lophiotrema nucula]